MEWDSAITTLNAIVPANDMEAGHSEVLLQVYRYGRTGLSQEFESEDYDVLYNLANENPKVYGEAVFTARALLDLVIHPELALDFEEERIGIIASTTNLVLAPNPSGGYFYISGVTASENVYQLFVKDILGKDFLQIKAYKCGNEVDIRHLAEGVYFVALQKGDEIIFKQKLIVTK